MNLGTLALTGAIAGSPRFCVLFHPMFLGHCHNLTLFISESDHHRNQSPHLDIIIIGIITVTSAKVIVVIVVMAPSSPSSITPPSLCLVHRAVRGLGLDSKCSLCVHSKKNTLSLRNGFNTNAFTRAKTAPCRSSHPTSETMLYQTEYIRN